MSSLYQAVLKGAYANGAQTRMVFNCQANGADSSEDVNAIGDWMKHLIVNMQPIQAPEHAWWGFDVNAPDTPGKWKPVASGIITGGGGTGSNGYNSNQDAAVALAKTKVKRALGRKFIPGIVDALIANGALTSTGFNFLLQFLFAWISDFLATNGVMVSPRVYSKKNDAWDNIYGGFADQVPGTQRRRKQGVGM